MQDMKAQLVTEGECVHSFCYGFHGAHPKLLIECDPRVIGVNHQGQFNSGCHGGLFDEQRSST